MTSCGRQDRSRSESVASKRATEELPVIARFEVRRRNYLAPDGSINRPLPVFAIDAKLLVALYRAMVLLRLFDRKAVALQRTGNLCRFARAGSGLGRDGQCDARRRRAATLLSG